MLPINIPQTERFDNSTQEFITTPSVSIQLEHSLISISKWESKWHKAFLKTELKGEELKSYLKCMTLTPHVPDEVYDVIMHSPKLNEIIDYIHNKMTATFFTETDKKGGGRDIVTSELIYYWMIQLQIPFECERWHLNRLLTLIEVCNRKNESPKNIPTKDLMNRNRALNAQRRAKLKSKG